MDSETREELVAMLNAVDPSTAHEPRYIVDAAEHPDRITMGAAGIYGPVQWHSLRSYVDWRGPGFATVVDTRRIPPSVLRAVVLHEFAHHYPMGPAYIGLYHHVQPDKRDEAMAECPAAAPVMRDDVQVLEASPIERPWDGHGPDFVRVLLHILHRSRQLGFFAFSSDAYALHERYTMPSIVEFDDALCDEPERLAGLSMLDVSTIEPPETYKQFSAETLATAERRFQERAGYESD